MTTDQKTPGWLGGEGAAWAMPQDTTDITDTTRPAPAERATGPAERRPGHEPARRSETAPPPQPRPGPGPDDRETSRPAPAAPRLVEHTVDVPGPAADRGDGSGPGAPHGPGARQAVPPDRDAFPEHGTPPNTPSDPRADPQADPRRYAQQGPQSRPAPAVRDWPAGGLSHDAIVRERAPRPRTGLRSIVYTVSGGRIVPRLSESELHRRELITRIKAQLRLPARITVASMKGGVGKTTVSALLGLFLAAHRGDRAIAVDANPDAGTLADRLAGEQPGPTIRDLINELPRINVMTDLDRFTRVAGRLRVLPSEQDPALSEQFNRAEYDAVIAVLASFYNVLITDSGTGVTHSAMHGALDSTDQLVVVGQPTVDGASRAARTLSWLAGHGFDSLVDNAVVVLSGDRRSRDVDDDRVRDYFAEIARAVVEIPADGHLATGGVIDPELLHHTTVDAALELAAHVADSFPHLHANGWR